MHGDRGGDISLGGVDAGSLGLVEPLVSIGIVNWNYAAYVGDAIASIRRQSYGKFECVVVDNGSTDDSVAVVRRHIEGDPRFSLIEFDKNYGHLGAAMRIFDRLRGEFVAFVDADDWLFPDFLATHLQVHLGMVRPKAMSSSNVIEVDAGGSILNSGPTAIAYGMERGTRGLRPPHIAARIAAISDRRYDRVSASAADLPSTVYGWFFGAGSANLYRRSIMELVRPDLGGEPYFAGVDGYFNPFCHGFTGSALIELPLSAYRVHGRNDYTMRGSGDGFWNGSENADVRSRAVRQLALSTFLDRAEQFAWYLGERFFDCISQFDAGRAWLRGRVLTDPQALSALGQAYERMCGIFGEARVYQQLRMRFTAAECAAIVARGSRWRPLRRLRVHRLQRAYRRNPNPQ